MSAASANNTRQQWQTTSIMVVMVHYVLCGCVPEVIVCLRWLCAWGDCVPEVVVPSYAVGFIYVAEDMPEVVVCLRWLYHHMLSVSFIYIPEDMSEVVVCLRWLYHHTLSVSYIYPWGYAWGGCVPEVVVPSYAVSFIYISEDMPEVVVCLRWLYHHMLSVSYISLRICLRWLCAWGGCTIICCRFHIYPWGYAWGGCVPEVVVPSYAVGFIYVPEDMPEVVVCLRWLYHHMLLVSYISLRWLCAWGGCTIICCRFHIYPWGYSWGGCVPKVVVPSYAVGFIYIPEVVVCLRWLYHHCCRFHIYPWRYA